MSQSPIDMLSIRESWRMFRILAEIVDGFETLSDLGPCVSIFGSARVKPENPLYAEGETIAKLLVESGYGVITGGASWKRATRELPRPEERPSACISSFPTNKNAISM